MTEIKIRPGKKSSKDKIVSINDIDINYNELSTQIQRLRDKHGEEEVRQILGIPNFKHHNKKIPELTLEEVKELTETFYALEDENYPPSKGHQGRKMLQQKLSRELFRTKKNQ